MAEKSSPLPIRHANTAPRSLSLGSVSARVPDRVDDDDDDELAGDTIPCSPPVFSRERVERPTQPTQILSRDHFQQPYSRLSSPASIIEVPASSPFQPTKPKSFTSRLAPAGTVFRQPARAQPPMAQKRPAEEPISLLSDDEDDLTPPRGDIRPTTFQAQLSAFAYNPEQEERQMRSKLRHIFDVFGSRFSSDKVRDALRKNRYDLDNAIDWLKRNHGLHRTSSHRHATTKVRGLHQTTLLNRSQGAPSIRGREDAVAGRPKPAERKTPAAAPRTPTPQKPKRRLIQGLRKRNASPSPQKPEGEVVHIPSSDDPLIIDVPDDKEDEYEAARSRSPSHDEDRVLNCVNTSTLKELAAMTGMSEAELAPVVDKRPFPSLTSARKVSAGGRPGARKSARLSVGESVVEAIEVFLNAVSAIDEVVSKCEEKAQLVKGVIDTWDIDSFGHQKRSRRGTPDKGFPPTPTSLDGLRFSRPVVPQQPELMSKDCELKPFQLFGLNWMTLLYNYNIGCILADEMGLGKTCQVISLLCHLVGEYERRPSGPRPWPNLIIVPPSTYENWLAEFERFAPRLSVVGYRGSQAERAEIAEEVYENAGDYHVVLGTYSQINSEEDIEAMQALRFNAAFFDEGHKMKNPETRIYKSLRRIPASWKMLLTGTFSLRDWCERGPKGIYPDSSIGNVVCMMLTWLTGTPVQNNLLEMTALLSFINPRLFDGYMEHIQYMFKQKVTIRDVSNGAFLYSERVKRARTILEPFILQRRKDQVLSDMPLKTNTVLECELTEAQASVYEEYEKKFRMEPWQRAAGRTSSTGRQNDQNNVWMQLRKAALHPLLFRRHFSDSEVEKMGQILMDRVPQSELHQPNIKHLIQELKNSSDFELHLWCRDYPNLLGQFDIAAAAELDSGKVKKLLELIAEYEKNGDRLLVFSKFSRLMELLQEVLARQGIEHRVLMGSTDVSERQQLIDEFNGDASIPVFLLTTGAGGTGINLTAANKVIIFDQSDNPQDDIQAENRAHRLGQKREVEVIRLISSKTVEELIYRACQKKIELANKVTGAMDEEGEQVERNMEREVRKMMEEREQMTPPQEEQVRGKDGPMRL